MNVTLSNKDVVKLRELNTGDIFDATDASKEVQLVEKLGAVFVIDHILLERLLLLKSVESVNDKPDQATLPWLRGLSPQDYDVLNNAVENVDSATLSEVGERGRDSAASG